MIHRWPWRFGRSWWGLVTLRKLPRSRAELVSIARIAGCTRYTLPAGAETQNWQQSSRGSRGSILDHHQRLSWLDISGKRPSFVLFGLSARWNQGKDLALEQQRHTWSQRLACVVYSELAYKLTSDLSETSVARGSSVPISPMEIVSWSMRYISASVKLDCLRPVRER